MKFVTGYKNIGRDKCGKFSRPQSFYDRGLKELIKLDSVAITLMESPHQVEKHRERINQLRKTYTGWAFESPQAVLDGYLTLVLSKVYWIREGEMWVDMGLSNHVGKLDFLRDFEPEKFLLLWYPYQTNTEIHGMKRSEMNRYCGVDFVSKVYRGGIFGGRNVEAVQEKYTEILDETLKDGNIGTEENIFTILAYRHPELFETYEFGRFCAGYCRTDMVLS